MGQRQRERARAEAARWMSGQNGQIHLVPRSPEGDDQEPASGGNSAVRGVAIFLAGVACGVGVMVVSPSWLPWSPTSQDNTTSMAVTSSVAAIYAPASMQFAGQPADAGTAAGSSSAGSAGVASTYVVQPGDSLARIADEFGVTLESLAASNGITDPARILVGQELLVPGTDPAGQPD